MSSLFPPDASLSGWKCGKFARSVTCLFSNWPNFIASRTFRGPPRSPCLERRTSYSFKRACSACSVTHGLTEPRGDPLPISEAFAFGLGVSAWVPFVSWKKKNAQDVYLKEGDSPSVKMLRLCSDPSRHQEGQGCGFSLFRSTLHKKSMRSAGQVSSLDVRRTGGALWREESPNKRVICEYDRNWETAFLWVLDRNDFHVLLGETAPDGYLRSDYLSLLYWTTRRNPDYGIFQDGNNFLRTQSDRRTRLTSECLKRTHQLRLVQTSGLWSIRGLGAALVLYGPCNPQLLDSCLKEMIP